MQFDISQVPELRSGVKEYCFVYLSYYYENVCLETCLS